MTNALAISPSTIQRFEAWWMGEVVDRPPVTLWVKPRRPYGGPVSQHTTLRERWLDAEFAVESAIGEISRRDYVGDNFPVFWPNVGPEITATLFGCELEFGETTIWSHPVVHKPEDWKRMITAPPNFGNVYWQTIERMTDYAIERCQGRYIVGITDLHGNYDILAALRDPQSLCMDLVDCPDLARRAGQNVAEGYVEAFKRSYQKLAAAGFGSTTWMPSYHVGPAYAPSSDFWCMVSTGMARKMILPDILREMEPLERSIFHLDGPQALKHLALLLKIPQLNAVQWVYGDGHGRAADWLDVYRRIRAAGKSVQVVAADAADALAVLREIGPSGVWLTVVQPFPSVGEANTFLETILI